jgi:YjbE family integral membrane protein
MDFFSVGFLSSLLTIVAIDLVLAGDNAMVIALAARSLPAELRKKAILWGTAGAIVIRAAMTIVVVWLLMVPGLRFTGGAVLVWIAYKLLVPHASKDKLQPHSAATFWAAMKTIVVADALMGLDNVLAVAGAAHGNFVLVSLGLMISIPLVVWGSTLMLKWIDRFPGLIYFGAGVLAWTAAQMMLDEPLLVAYLHGQPIIKAAVYLTIVSGVLFAGLLAARRRAAFR